VLTMALDDSGQFGYRPLLDALVDALTELAAGGLLTEDESKSGKEQVQELTKTYETKVDEMVEKKKHEILQV